MLLYKSSANVFAINDLDKFFFLYGSNVSISNYILFWLARQSALPCSEPSNRYNFAKRRGFLLDVSWTLLLSGFLRYITTSRWFDLLALELLADFFLIDTLNIIPKILKAISDEKKRIDALKFLRIASDRIAEEDVFHIYLQTLYEHMSVESSYYLNETGDLSGLQYVFSAYETMEKSGVGEYYSDFTIYSMLNFYYYLLDVRYRFALDRTVLNSIYKVVDYFSTIVHRYMVKDNNFYKLLCAISALIAVLIPDKEPEKISYLHVIDNSVVGNFVSGAKFYHLGKLAKNMDVDAAFQALEKAFSIFNKETLVTEKIIIRHLMDVIYGECLNCFSKESSTLLTETVI